jgi:hypothetical protein
MKRFLKVVGALLLIVVFAVGLLVIGTEHMRRAAAVRQAIDATQAEAEVQRKAAVAEAVAEAEARVRAEAPVLPVVGTRLKTDPETLALFPKDAYLTEVAGKYQDARCKEQLEKVLWVRLNPDADRSTIEEQRPSGARILAGLLTFGLSEVYASQAPIRTVFSAETSGPYTIFNLGALRKSNDPEFVEEQMRLTLYRLDNASFGVVEWVPADERPAARPLNRAPKIGKVFRRCIYKDGASEL